MANRQWLFKQANHGAYIRILVYRWRLRTRILALARRWTLTQALVMCVTGYPTPQLFQNSTQQLSIPKLKHLNAQEKFLHCTLLYTTCVFTALYYLSVTEEVDTTVAQYLSCHCTKRVPWTNAFCWEDLISSPEEGNISNVCIAVVNSSEDWGCKFAQHC